MIDTQTKEIIRSYKSNQASKYIPVRGDEILTRIFDCEKYHISTKHDGHLCFIIKNETDLMLSNFNGELFDRPDLILEITNLLETESGIFVGEIYNYKESERSRSFDLVKNISNPKSIIKIAVFDIISNGDNVFEFGDWEEKRKLISSLFSKGEKIHPVEEIEVVSRKDIQAEFEDRVNNQNQEGLIVKGFNGPIFKIKPKLTFDFVILGYSLGYSQNFTLLKEFLFGLITPENNYLIVGKVSGGFSIDQRETLVKQLEPLKVTSNIIEASGSKIPFTFIKPELVVEIEAVDIINKNSEQLIQKSVLKFEDNCYKKTLNSPSVSLISPVFCGIREDKKVSSDQVGLSQVTRLIELADVKDVAIEKTPSTLIKKEVYVKVTKGIQTVKKFFIWKTNSDLETYPSYVFYKIDYSPTRADKLTRDIKVSNNEKQIHEIFTSEIESNIKKGWDIYK